MISDKLGQYKNTSKVLNNLMIYIQNIIGGYSFKVLHSDFLGASNPHEPGPAQGGMGAPQAGGSGPPPPELLQKARTAHLASRLTLFTSGFLYSFFLFFSKAFPHKCSV
jgi:hypothetical protein